MADLQAKKQQLIDLAAEIQSIEGRKEVEYEPEAYAAVLRLENELRAKGRDLTSSVDERKALEKAVRQKDAALMKLTKDVEDASEKILQLDQENKRLKKESGDLRKDNELLTRMQAAQLRREDGAEEDRSGLSESGLDTIVRLENELVLKNNELESLKGEKRTLEKMLHSKDVAIKKMDEQLQAKDRQDADALAAVNELRKLKMDIMELEEEKRTLVEIQRLKNRALETLTQQLDEKLALEEQFKAAQREMETKNTEMQALQLRCEQLEKQQSRKDEELERVASQIEQQSRVKYTESDVRYLQSEIKKHMTVRQQQERTIRAQQSRLEQLTMRIQVVADALADVKRGGRSLASVEVPARDVERRGEDGGADDEPAEEPVTAESIEQETAEEKVEATLFELVQRDVERLRAAVEEKDALIEEKDAAMESVTRTVDILKGARSSDSKRYRTQQSELQGAVQRMQDQMQQMERDAKLREQEIRKENIRLKARVQSLREQAKADGSA